ncbi:MAG: hypothetical protein IPJ41_06795 [Phycisphaerales bacterium]|nr:hypothetical protein [Phycisphaerales bacterium]
MNRRPTSTPPCINVRLSVDSRRRTALGGVVAIAVVAASAHAANLLVDPGFELNPLNNYSTVLNNFSGYKGDWGVENSTITGAVGSVTPAGGVQMLSMFDDGLSITQAWQVTDVSGIPAIAGGSATFSLSAMFTAENAPAARASIFMQFFSGAGLGFEIPSSQLSMSLNLNNSPGIWEPITVSGAIPASTTWMVSQVGYWNATMGGQPGYVDAVSFTIIPAPAPCALLGAVGLLGVRRRRAIAA